MRAEKGLTFLKDTISLGELDTCLAQYMYDIFSTELMKTGVISTDDLKICMQETQALYARCGMTSFNYSTILAGVAQTKVDTTLLKQTLVYDLQHGHIEEEYIFNCLSWGFYHNFLKDLLGKEPIYPSHSIKLFLRGAVKEIYFGFGADKLEDKVLLNLKMVVGQYPDVFYNFVETVAVEEDTLFDSKREDLQALGQCLQDVELSVPYSLAQLMQQVWIDNDGINDDFPAYLRAVIEKTDIAGHVSEHINKKKHTTKVM